MSRFEDLRNQCLELWEQVVEHKFTHELGNDSLPIEKFQHYFLQDYAFLRDFVLLIALGIAKAPTMDAARPLAAFLHEILEGEEVLFGRTFKSWGWTPEKYLDPCVEPAASALGNLMVRVAYEGSFAEVMTVLAVTEGTYLDWPARLKRRGLEPKTPIYHDWIELHASPEFEAFVGGFLTTLDSLALTGEQEARATRLFKITLQHELDFFNMGYSGKSGGE